MGEALEARRRRHGRRRSAKTGFPAEAVRAYLEELGVPKHDVRLDLAAPAASPRSSARRAVGRGARRRVGLPGLARAGAARRARSRARRGSTPTLVLEPQPAAGRCTRDARAVPRARRGGERIRRRVVRELKAVGGHLHALRQALTGAERGPELWAVIAALPRDEALQARAMRLYDTYRVRSSSCRRLRARCGCTSAARPSTRARTSATRARSCSGCGCARGCATGYDATLVHNITDVNDKIYDAAPGASAELAADATDWYLEDTGDFGLGMPDHLPKVTDHVPAIVRFIEELVDRGLRLPGRRRRVLPRRALPGVRAPLGPAARPGRGAGAEPAQGGRPRLRALEGEQAGRGHPVGLAVGRRAGPAGTSSARRWRRSSSGRRSRSTAAGSTSSSRTTRTSSRSRGRSGTSSRSIWAHNGLLQFTGDKMSKSLGNIATIREVLDEWGRETALVFFLDGHWRKPIDFSDETMEQARAQARGVPRGVPRRRASPTGTGRDSQPRSTTTSTRPLRLR